MNIRTGNAILAEFQAAGAERTQSGAAVARQATCDEFDALVREHQPQIARLVARLLAWPQDQAYVDDVVQEVFLSAWQRYAAFRGDSEITTWLNRIAINKSRNYIRRRVTVAKVMTTLKSVFAPPNEASRPNTEQFDQLHNAIGRLRSADREIIVLRYLQENTPEEIGELLQIKRNTVDVRLRRARQRLETIINESNAKTVDE